MLAHCTIELRIGATRLPVALLARDGALVATLLDLEPAAARARFARTGELPAAEDPGPFRAVIEELRRYEAGEAVEWRSPIRIEGGTSFQRMIWERIAGIPTGSTRSYGELAALAGAPGGARAAGGACGRNPLPLRVPCHRVVAAGGSLGGFTGLLATKRLLLAHEGVAAGAPGNRPASPSLPLGHGTPGASGSPRVGPPEPRQRAVQPWLSDPRTPSFFTL